MKIVVIAQTVDERSGWGRYAANVIRETREAGVEVVVVSAPELLPFSLSSFFKNVSLIRKQIKDGVDAVHAFDCWPLGVYAAFALLGKKVNLFMTGVGTYSIPPRARLLKSWLMKYAYNRAKEVFCISRYSLMRIKDRAPKARFSIAHWGTTPLPVPEDLRSFYGIPIDARPILLTVGEIKHRKGQLDTLEAVKILKRTYPNILYIALGSTAKKTYVSAMHKYAEENDLTGNFLVVDNCKTDKGLAFFYDLEDVFVMNSNNEGDHFEGFGLVFLEASQFSKPLVGSSDCGIEDAIIDGETGYLTKQGDSKDIAEKINLALSNRVELGKRARSRAKEFTWKQTVSKHINVYEKYV